MLARLAVEISSRHFDSIDDIIELTNQRYEEYCWDSQEAGRIDLMW